MLSDDGSPGVGELLKLLARGRRPGGTSVAMEVGLPGARSLLELAGSVERQRKIEHGLLGRGVDGDGRPKGLVQSSP